MHSRPPNGSVLTFIYSTCLMYSLMYKHPFSSIYGTAPYKFHTYHCLQNASTC